MQLLTNIVAASEKPTHRLYIQGQQFHIKLRTKEYSASSNHMKLLEKSFLNSNHFLLGFWLAPQQLLTNCHRGSAYENISRPSASANTLLIRGLWKYYNGNSIVRKCHFLYSFPYIFQQIINQFLINSLDFLLEDQI